MSKMHSTKKLGKVWKLNVLEGKSFNMCRNSPEDEEEAAKLLKENLTTGEAGSLWAKHQSHLEQKDEYERRGRKEKGLAAALWLVTSKC